MVSDKSIYVALQSGINRLYVYLDHLKKLPTSIKAAACVSGISENDISRVLDEYYFGYTIENGMIYKVMEPSNGQAVKVVDAGA